MEPQFRLGDDLSALEHALKQLAPVPARLDVAQTMFRAGQASVRRPSAVQRIWPVTSALLALASLTLGLLLMIPEQPRIVYVPVLAAVDAKRTPQLPTVAETSHTDTDNISSASSPRKDADISPPDTRLLSPLSHFRARDLAARNSWDAMSSASPASSQAEIAPLCSRDWRTMAAGDTLGRLPHAADSFLPFDLKHLLYSRGS